MAITTTNWVEYLLELEGELEFIWDRIFTELSRHHYNYDFINMHSRSFKWKISNWLRYTETVPIKSTFIVGKVISQIKASILFFLKTCCVKSIKKRITIRISQDKNQTFKEFSLWKFLSFRADPQKI